MENSGSRVRAAPHPGGPWLARGRNIYRTRRDPGRIMDVPHSGVGEVIVEREVKRPASPDTVRHGRAVWV